jgi:molecular chaperone DnaK
MTSRVVGIDLGTTFSAIAVVNEHGKPEIIPNHDGEAITPSVVMFRGNLPIVGTAAKNSAVSDPLSVVQAVKRQMGVPAFNFRSGDGSKYSAEEISALILKKLKSDAEDHLGWKVVDAVITVPAYFADAQRKATLDAGRIAGLNVLRIINEPTAAALAYGLEKAKGQQTILIYDLGGGTFDVTIMRIGAGRLDVLATGGDRNLGGFDWDNYVRTYLNDEFQKTGGPDLNEDPALEQDLWNKAVRAKESLSTRERADVYLSAGGKTATVRLTLAHFQEMTRPLIERSGTIMRGVLEDSGLSWDQIDKCLLVGGSTRMKAVPALVEAVSGKKPSCELHPDKVVALGAAVQGAMLHVEAGKSNLVETGTFPLVVIRDATSHSKGVVAHDDMHRPHNSIVLPKNTPFGEPAEEVFCTLEDGQQAIRVQVTEGEGEDVSDIRVLNGDGEEIAIPPYPKGAPIRVSFLHTPNGTLQVRLFDMTATKPLGEFVLRAFNQTEEQVEASIRRVAPISVQ